MVSHRSFRSDESDQRRAVRAWVGTFFRDAQGSDADEPPDQVELAGSSMVVLTGVYTAQWPAKCPGVMCYRRADDCNVCIHGGAKLKRTLSDEKMDMTDVEELLKKFGTLHLPAKEVKRAFQSRNDALYEQYALVSTCRGNRVRSELRMSGRMGL